MTSTALSWSKANRSTLLQLLVLFCVVVVVMCFGILSLQDHGGAGQAGLTLTTMRGELKGSGV